MIHLNKWVPKGKFRRFRRFSSPPSHFLGKTKVFPSYICVLRSLCACLPGVGLYRPFSTQLSGGWLAENGKREKNLFQCLGDGLCCRRKMGKLWILVLWMDNMFPLKLHWMMMNPVLSRLGGICEIPWCVLFGRPYRPLKHGIRARSCICLGRMKEADFEPPNGCHGYPTWDD